MFDYSLKLLLASSFFLLKSTMNKKPKIKEMFRNWLLILWLIALVSLTIYALIKQIS